MLAGCSHTAKHCRAVQIKGVNIELYPGCKRKSCWEYSAFPSTSPQLAVRIQRWNLAMESFAKSPCATPSGLHVPTSEFCTPYDQRKVLYLALQWPILGRFRPKQHNSKKIYPTSHRRPIYIPSRSTHLQVLACLQRKALVLQSHLLNMQPMWDLHWVCSIMPHVAKKSMMCLLFLDIPLTFLLIFSIRQTAFMHIDPIPDPSTPRSCVWSTQTLARDKRVAELTFICLLAHTLQMCVNSMPDVPVHAFAWAGLPWLFRLDLCTLQW